MIIISQDKMEVFNFNEIFRLYVDNWSNEEFATEPNCFCIKAEKSSDNMICAFLGEYSTEERAKEVLQGIYASYSVEEVFKRADRDVQDIISEKYKKSETIPFVFQMPEK